MSAQEMTRTRTEEYRTQMFLVIVPYIFFSSVPMSLYNMFCKKFYTDGLQI